MEKNVVINLESGNNSLTKMFNRGELEGKSIKDVIEMIMNHQWGGEDIKRFQLIKNEMNYSSRYYTEIIPIRRYLPVRSYPVKPEECIQPYLQKSPLNHLVICIKATQQK